MNTRTPVRLHDENGLLRFRVGSPRSRCDVRREGERRPSRRRLGFRRRLAGEWLEARQLLAAEPSDPTAAAVVINELHVNPDLETQLVEFIELHNRSDRGVDLSGWFFTEGVEYVFAQGVEIPAGGYLAVSENAEQFQAKFSQTALGPWGGKLRNEGEKLELRNRAGALVDEVTYGLGFPWPTVGDAPGLSMQLVRPDMDNDQGGAWRSALPTPLAANSVLVENPAPRLRQVEHFPEQPKSGEAVRVTVRASDPDGVAEVRLDYQAVEPGSYIRKSDAAYSANWTTLPMRDDGTQGDAVAGDGLYTLLLPGNLQTHRHLLRYRITAVDRGGNSATGPSADDPQPNFAYFVFDGVPDWTGAKRPGTTPAVTYSSSTLTTLPTYHFIAQGQDVTWSQYDSRYNLKEFQATVVYDGIVYDHITFRNRGRASTYQVGKNKWKINFNRGHSFQARDNYGNRYSVDWDKINVLPGTNPWWRNDVSTDGTVLFEPVAFRLYGLAGTPSPNTHYFQFRVIDNAVETSPTSQYEGDFWGLYIAIQQPDGRFLEERGLDEGSVFNIHGSASGSTVRHQGSLLPSNRSDLTAFIRDSSRTMTEEWWRANLNFDSYFAFNAINLAVNNSDLRPNENVDYYHNQVNNQWYTIPWDLDLTFEDRPHLGRPDSQWESIQLIFNRYPVFKLAYQNRAREIVDLLLDNGDAAKLVDEYAGFLREGDPVNNVVEANQAQWDYHPRKAKKGIWYKNFTPALMPEQSFAGLVSYMQKFLGPGGYGRDRLVAKYQSAVTPVRPEISSAGPASFPVNQVRLRSSDYADGAGGESFAAMEWQVSEVNLPGVVGYDAARPHAYEMEGMRWKSGPQASFAAEVDVPVAALQAGRSYRARVRMQNKEGQWSNWSVPLEFVASPGVSAVTQYLRVGEVHYHPADPTPAELAAGFTNSDDFEFIELVNTGPQTLDLVGTRFTKMVANGVESGVEFDFSEAAIRRLEPGQRLVVVEDLAAFQFRYGRQLPVAGEWLNGQLSNRVETLTLESLGKVVQKFEYSDAWYPETDGDGPSLEVNQVGSGDLALWSTAAGWRPSRQAGGTPGSDGSGVVIGDASRDGVFNSADLVLVFQAGKYEDGIPKNARWEEGDWNGDEDFTTADLVLAFQAGTYGAGATPRPVAIADARPTSVASGNPWYLPWQAAARVAAKPQKLDPQPVDSLFAWEDDAS